MEIVQIPLDKLLEIIRPQEFNAFDSISLIITIVLGIISLTMAYVAYKLSENFEKRSVAALDKIKELSIQVNQKIESGMLNQQEMSNKMLDSIITNNYGIDQNPNNIVLKAKDVEEANKQISEIIEEKLEKIGDKDLRTDLDELKNKITTISKSLVKRSANIISDHLFRKISDFQEYPAFVILLNAIERAKCTSLSDVEKIVTKYSIPGDFDQGVEKLIEDDILFGDIDNFEINPEYIDDIRAFLDVNIVVINELTPIYKVKDPTDDKVTKEETLLARKLNF